MNRQRAAFFTASGLRIPALLPIDYLLPVQWHRFFLQ